MRRLAYLSAAIIWLTSMSGRAADNPKTIEMTLLGIPVAGKPIAAQKILVLQPYHERLYLGHGSQKADTGPTDVVYYDFESREFKTEFRVDDEEINRYRVLNDLLVIPGADATEDWSFGNVYVYDGTRWTKHRNVKSALHVFDMAALGDRWYICTHSFFDGFPYGTEGKPGEGMILSSADKGQSWRLEYAESCQIDQDSFIRNLVAFQGKLYAFPDAQTFPNTEEYKAKYGKSSKPILDLHGANETLVYSEGRWRPIDLVPLSGVRRVTPHLAATRLGLWVTQMEGEKAVTKVFVYDGSTTKTVDAPLQDWKPFSSQSGDVFLVSEQNDRWHVRVTRDFESWAEFILNLSASGVTSVVKYKERLYIGTDDGKVYESAQTIFADERK